VEAERTPAPHVPPLSDSMDTSSFDDFGAVYMDPTRPLSKFELDRFATI